MARMGWAASVGGVLMGLLLNTGAAQARELAGVAVPEALTLEGKQVSLAHTELHEQFFFKVYVWSLYMEQVPRVESEAISTNCVKRLHFRFLRAVSRDQLVGAFRDGLAKNPALRGEARKAELERLLASLKDVPKGGELVITYLPEGGLHVSGEASRGIRFQGKAFADALFVSWLDQHPIFK